MGGTQRGSDDGGAGPAGGAPAVIRVERGLAATDEELAAVTAVLLSLLADRGGDTGAEDDDGTGGGVLPDAPRWRPERPAAAYRSPYSWR